MQNILDYLTKIKKKKEKLIVHRSVFEQPHKYRFTFVSITAFESQCDVILLSDFEDISLQEWVKNRQNDFVRERSSDFYLGGDFAQTRTLGSGSFGNVYLVENPHCDTSKTVAEARSDEHLHDEG